MNLTIEHLDQRDLFVLLQVFMVAKFDSSRSSAMMGSPIVNRVLEQILVYEFDEQFMVNSLARLRSTELGARHIAKIRKALAETRVDFKVDDLEQLIIQMAFPYRLSHDILLSLVEEANLRS